ncbi:MAG: hypothetical protein ABJH52_17275 [Henriciella sp.]
MGLQEKIEEGISRETRKKEVDQVKAKEAGLSRLKDKVGLYLLAAFILSGVSSARGFYLLAESAGSVDYMSIIYTTMCAVVSAVLLAGSVTTLMRIAGDLGDGASSAWLWIRFAILMAIIVPFIFGVSTIMAMFGTSGIPALSFDLQDRVPQYERFIDVQTADGNKASQAFAVVEPIRATVCDDADGALKGRITGVGGAGAVSAGYAKGCAYTGKVAETLSDMATAQAERRRQLSGLVEQLALVPRDSELSVFERRDRYRVLTTEIDAILRESDAANVADTLKAQMANLNGLVATVPIRPGPHADVQRAAMDALQGYFETIETTVSDLMDADAVLTSGVDRPGELMPMHEAVYKYRDRLAPGLILAVAIDTMCIFFALAIALSGSIVKLTRESIGTSSAWFDLPNIATPNFGRGKPTKEENHDE